MAGRQHALAWSSRPCVRGLAGEAAQHAAPSGGPKWGGKSPITINSMVAGLALFLGVVAVAQNHAQEKVSDMMQRSQQVVGKAAVGGPFSLLDQDGKRFTHQDLEGSWSMLYFGFTHCPDICPDELEKLAESVDAVEKQTGQKIRPVFISIDPARDTPAKVKAYVSEFHPRLVGLTGSEEEVRKTSKAYRVYFHKTSDDPADYLVDHSIIMYLLDPNGEFVTFYGKNFTAQQLADSIAGHMAQWASGAHSSAPGGPCGRQAGSQEGVAQK